MDEFKSKLRRQSPMAVGKYEEITGMSFAKDSGRGGPTDRHRHEEAFMSTSRIDLSLPLAIVELVARVGSIASITLLVLLFLDEGLHPSEISPNEWAGLLFFPLGVMIGMIVAWWKEGLGSAVTLVSLVAFYLVYGYLLRNHIGGWVFIAFASPGFLFLLHWLLSAAGEKHMPWARDEDRIRPARQPLAH